MYVCAKLPVILSTYLRIRSSSNVLSPPSVPARSSIDSGLGNDEGSRFRSGDGVDATSSSTGWAAGAPSMPVSKLSRGSQEVRSGGARGAHQQS